MEGERHNIGGTEPSVRGQCVDAKAKEEESSDERFEGGVFQEFCSRRVCECCEGKKAEQGEKFEGVAWGNSKEGED